MSTMIRNNSGSNLPLPAAYGGGFLCPSFGLILEDTLANVQAALAAYAIPATAGIYLSEVPSGQPGAITPLTSGLLPPTTNAMTAAIAAAVNAAYLVTPVAAVSSAHPVATTECVLICTASPTVTLPIATSFPNRVVTIKNAGVGTVTIARASSDTIFTTTAQTSLTLDPGDAATLVSDGTSSWAQI